MEHPPVGKSSSTLHCLQMGARGHGCTLTDPFQGAPRHSNLVLSVSFFSMQRHCLHSNHAAGRLIHDVGVVRNSGLARLNFINFPVKSFSRGFRWSKFRHITQFRGESAQKVETGSLNKDTLLPGVHRASS